MRSRSRLRLRTSASSSHEHSREHVREQPRSEGMRIAAQLREHPRRDQCRSTRNARPIDSVWTDTSTSPSISTRYCGAFAASFERAASILPPAGRPQRFPCAGGRRAEHRVVARRAWRSQPGDLLADAVMRRGAFDVVHRRRSTTRSTPARRAARCRQCASRSSRAATACTGS
jgi:hypothetical protein